MIGDYQASEWAVALVVGLSVLGSAGIAARAVDLGQVAATPEIDRGTAVPVRVVPVVDLDAPLLKLGGAIDPNKLPDRWQKPKAKPRAEEKAFVTPKAGQSASDIPSARVPVASASAKPPPPDAEITKKVDTELQEVPDAGKVATLNTPGASDGVKEGTEADPLKARAVDLYRQRIIAWFSSRFRVSGSGLSQEQLQKLRASATVELSADRHVASYVLRSSGNEAFDAAARRTLDGAKGEAIPPPPENYPDTVQSSISLTFVCKENRCD